MSIEGIVHVIDDDDAVRQSLAFLLGAGAIAASAKVEDLLFGRLGKVKLALALPEGGRLAAGLPADVRAGGLDLERHRRL